MPLKPKRVLMSVSDKAGIVELAQAFVESGAAIYATGNTADVLKKKGLVIHPVEQLTGTPEAFQGRMKTLSFQICSALLFRRNDPKDQEDARRLGIEPLDAVVVNFYPFEKTQSVEQIDIGGPTLVRAAAKNSPDVAAITSPDQYARVMGELVKFGSLSETLVKDLSVEAWDRVAEYDQSIAQVMGRSALKNHPLRYGENPHQEALLLVGNDSPIAWPLNPEEKLGAEELSYNNIQDVSAAFQLASELKKILPDSTGVVIVKHNNPCGVCFVPRTESGLDRAQKTALFRAWHGDSISAFGGVVLFTDPLQEASAEWLSRNFIELIAAPALTQRDLALGTLLSRRKKLKAVRINRFQVQKGKEKRCVPGGVLIQETDTGLDETLKSVTKKQWSPEKNPLGLFGVAICRALKSNAVALVRELQQNPGAYELVGAGQGQPNRVDAIRRLAIPRAQDSLRQTEGVLGECVLISDAFFPFRDAVDAAHLAGIRWIVQPGGSMRDSEVIGACDEHAIAMAFTGRRHFTH